MNEGIMEASQTLGHMGYFILLLTRFDMRFQHNSITILYFRKTLNVGVAQQLF